MPEGPSGAAEVSRKRGADPGLLLKHVPERKRACWGILTSQGLLKFTALKMETAARVHRLFRGPVPAGSPPSLCPLTKVRKDKQKEWRDSAKIKMSYIYQWLDVPWGDGDMGSWADRSPLHEAASQGRLLALRTLLAQGYHANIVTIDHVTPLHEACLSGHVACVRALINAGANVNAATIDGVTPLYNCCASGSAGCMELLLQSGAHTRAPHTHFPSALHEACKRGNSQCVESLLSHGADPDYEVSHLGSPLYVSCLHRHTACSRVLLHRGADVSVGRGCDSPLHAAVRQDSADQVSLLLDYGADINFRDSNNQRPVDLAPPGRKTQQLLLAFEVSPRSLCQLCRLHIRNLIGRSRLKLLPLLPLPALLTHYLEHISNEQ